MNMQKHYLNLAILLMAGLVNAGCQKDEVGGFTPAAPGDAIEFAVNAVKTRTAYVSDNQIDWTGGENIRIYSDVADKKDQSGTTTEGTTAGWLNDAVYTVTPVEDGGVHEYHGNFTAAQGYYLAWSGISDTHEFYGIYPNERLNYGKSTPKDGLFQLQYITNQKCKVTTENNNYYIAEPDMLNAYMVAHNRVVRTENHVLLDFDPIMTTLDIIIKAGGYEVATGIIQPLTVTGVSVTLPVVLGKDYFTYNATNIQNSNEEGSQGQGKLQEELGEGSESVFISFTDKKSGKPMNISLSEGDSIKLTAFLPPIPTDKTSQAQIKVHTLENFKFVATLNKPLQAQYKIEIPLPDVKPNSPKNTNWISQLDGNIKLTELSIPGYYCDGSENGAVINELLQKGIRVFDIQGLSGRSHKEQMKSVVEALNTFINENPNEFIFTTVDDRDSSPDGLTKPTVDFDEDNWETTTISQLRGQIIALFFYNAAPYAYVQIDKTPAFLHCTFDREADYASVINNPDWNLRYKIDVHDYSSNQSAYTEIVNCTDQKDRCTGILMVPYANQTYVDGEYTYSDLLIQSIIDCNFKFILDRN